MEHFIQPKVTAIVLDYARAFSPSLVSLVGLIWLGVTMIAVIALRRYELKKPQLVLHEHSSADQRKRA